MDYDLLRIFVHLSKTLHFGRTSRACNISPSALSRAIARLEQRVGCTLLERDRRKVALTDEGRRFAEHAAETLQRWDALAERLRQPDDGLQGRISIFASVTACQSFLPRLLAAFRQEHPEIHIQLETGYAADAIEMVQKERVDVAVAALPDRIPAGLVTRVLLYTPLCFVAPAAPCDVSRLANQRPIPFAKVPIVLPRSGLARREVDAWFRRRRQKPTVYSEVPGSEAILSLVALGCGVGIVPRLVVDRSPLRADVRPLDVEPPLGEFRVGLCTLKKKWSTPLIQALWQSTNAGW